MMNRKLFVLILLLFSFLFILSSCYSVGTVNDMLDEKEEQWSEKYNALEDKYYSASSRVYELESALSSINDDFSTVYCYYLDSSDDISEDEALSALSRINDKLHELGY